MQRMATAANDDDARRMLLVLDAFSAVVKRQSNAEVALQRADSAVRGWAFRHEPFSILQGWGWYEVGRYDRALLAIRRRVAVLGFPFFVGLAEALRLEGKIAAKAGDMPGAILAYERYLRLRHDPEPVKKPQRDSVVAELAALKR
jgi:hypothetical protein